ncbi:hypothetical protein Bca52824_078726 [Brassica carinata]|uniref:Wall-associated receptor kinase domain-containing protein n=1 Tax=Brassica carinata TaxID=52824 RepID=A0A8X7PXY6_BRACI|nr:hypothetical protein Bca52824_078726 [Brassica carinata]
MRSNTNYSLSILLSAHPCYKVVTLWGSRQSESCGSIKIQYPFGIQEGRYLNECDVTYERRPILDNTGCSSNALSYAYRFRGCAANNKGEEERSCNGNGCCRARLPDDAEAQQVIGVRIESLDNVSSTSGGCRVA